MRGGEGDEGFATVWAAGAIVVVLVVTVAWIQLGAILVARHQAESAADLAALAAAGRAVVGEEVACSRAQELVERSGAQLTSCRLAGWDALVQVSARPSGPLADLGAATSRARAGPASGVGAGGPG